MQNSMKNWGTNPSRYEKSTFKCKMFFWRGLFDTEDAQIDIYNMGKSLYTDRTSLNAPSMCV